MDKVKDNTKWLLFAVAFLALGWLAWLVVRWLAQQDAKLERLGNDMGRALKQVRADSKEMVLAVAAAARPKELAAPVDLPKGFAGFGQTAPASTPWAA